MNHRSDPTANAAIGSVQREWERLAKLAERIRLEPCSEWSLRQKRRFTGIYRRLLDDKAADGAANRIDAGDLDLIGAPKGFLDRLGRREAGSGHQIGFRTGGEREA